MAFFVGPANLQGVHTAPLTGGPTMFFGGLAPYISRVQLGVVRTGTNALAGQTPDPTYHIDPFICATNYGYYAEWYPSGGILNNVDNISDLGTGGPVGDLRTCVVPEPVAGGYYYLRWSLQNQVFGPTVQDNADVIMTLTYYDDPALAGKVLFANTYSTMENGNITIANFTTTADYNGAVTLKGSGQWKEAQFEIPDVNFQNGGGQWVCRYAANAQIQVCRVRYNVFRPCGPFQGIDYLQTMGMTNANPDLKVNWRGTGNLRAAPVVTGPYTSLVNLTNTAKNVITLPMTNDAQFLRLQFPSYPSYLSTNGP